MFYNEENVHDVVVAHSQRHHAAHLYYGLTKVCDNAKYIVPFYPKGFGSFVASFENAMSRKAKGFFHEKINARDVISPFHLQLAKIFSAKYNPESIEKIFDLWLSRNIKNKNIKCKLLVTLQDFCPLSVAAAKDQGAVIWSDQILNSSEDTAKRIAAHCSDFGIKNPKNDESVNNKILKMADIVSYPSDFVRNGLDGRISSDVIRAHVPYGVDTNLFYPIAKVSESDDEFHLVARANSVRKGGHLLLGAIFKAGNEFLKRSGKKMLRITIVGSISKEIIPLLANFDGMSWCKISARNFNYIDLPHLLSTADLFAMPSLAEGMSLMVPEALACGVPVLGTSYCGVDYLREGFNGVVVDDNVDSLIDGLYRYLNYASSDVYRMRENARKSAMEHDWNRYSDGIANFFKSSIV